MNRRKEVSRAKNRERQRIKQGGREKEVTSMLLKRPSVMLDHEGEVFSVIANQELPSHHFVCCECNKWITGPAYQFTRDLACESCVSNYYRLSNQELSDVIPKEEKRLAEELAAELPRRAREADRILREREKRKRRHAF